MKINCYLKSDKARLPVKSYQSDACFDLFAAEIIPSPYSDLLVETIGYDTGVSFDIPPGYCGKLYARSSVLKTGLSLVNSVGIIDAGYKGTIKVYFYKHSNKCVPYEVGDRIAQIMIQPLLDVELEEVPYLIYDSERGEGGFGSTGK